MPYPDYRGYRVADNPPRTTVCPCVLANSDQRLSRSGAHLFGSRRQREGLGGSRTRTPHHRSQGKSPRGRGGHTSNPYRKRYRKTQTRPKAGNEAQCPAEDAPKPQPARKVPAAAHGSSDYGEGEADEYAGKDWKEGTPHVPHNVGAGEEGRLLRGVSRFRPLVGEKLGGKAVNHDLDQVNAAAEDRQIAP